MTNDLGAVRLDDAAARHDCAGLLCEAAQLPCVPSRSHLHFVIQARSAEVISSSHALR
jgi:hypothetical protein